MDEFAVFTYLYARPNASYSYLFHTPIRMPALLSRVGLSLKCEGTPVRSVGGEGNPN